MSTNPISTATGTARSRLSAEQERSLRSQAASFAMEGMPLGEEHLEVLAAYSLGDISAEDCDARLDALP